MKKITVFLLVLASLFSCSKDISKIDIFNQYLTSFSNINIMNAKVTFKNKESTVNYDVNFNLEGRSTFKKIQKGETTSYIIENNSLSAYKSNKKIQLNNQQRNNNIILLTKVLINPYYSLSTSIDNYEIIEAENKITLKHSDSKNSYIGQIFFSENKITKIILMINNKNIYEVNYSNFIKLSNGLYFPSTYERKDYNIKTEMSVNYEIKTISF